MIGWKICLDYQATGQFCSAFTPATGWCKWLYLNQPCLSPSAPLFLHSDDAAAADLLWALRSNGVLAAPVALLRVEAQDAFPVSLVAQEIADYGAYWDAWRQGGLWAAERAYATRPHTFAAKAITPLAVAWRGLQFEQGQDVSARLAEVDAGMNAARNGGNPAPVTDKQIFFPVAR